MRKLMSWLGICGVYVCAACGTPDPVSLFPAQAGKDQQEVALAVHSQERTCTPARLTAYLDIPYQSIPGVDPNLLSLDIYPAGSQTCDQPVVVWVHGGGWRRGDKSNSIADKRRLFNEAGYLLVSVNYRLSPDPSQLWNPFRIKYPIHPQDVATALNWISNNIRTYGGDSDKIALLGHSAGGGIVAVLGTNESFLQAQGKDLDLLSCVGSLDTEAYDIPTQMETASLGTRNLYINAFGALPSIWSEASPINHLEASKGIPPFLLVARGSLQRQAMVTNFAQELESVGASTTMIQALELSHEEVNTLIGKPGDSVMTPPLMQFLSQCFSR